MDAPIQVFRRRAPRHRLIIQCAIFVAAIGVASRLSADGPGIYVMKLDGSEERKVVAVAGRHHTTPRWSHDGTRLVFDTHDVDGSTVKLFMVNVDGTDLQEFREQGTMPDWSPDDKQLIFHHEGGGGMREGVWVQNLDGKGREWVIDGAWPRWSPDGGTIAFTLDNCIKLLDVASGEDRMLVDETFAQRPGAFAWSRDGKRVSFITRRVAGGLRELFIVNTRDTTQVLTPRLARGGMFGGHVSWSPDDKQLAFTIDSYIHVLDVEGNGEPDRLGGQPEPSRDPAWSPDGKWIAFARRDR